MRPGFAPDVTNADEVQEQLDAKPINRIAVWDNRAALILPTAGSVAGLGAAVTVRKGALETSCAENSAASWASRVLGNVISPGDVDLIGGLIKFTMP